MKQTDYLPWYLGGDWNKTNHRVVSLVAGSPFIETPSSHRMFFHVSLAHYLSDTVEAILFQQEDPIFVNMILHHLTASALIWCCIYTNMVRVGLVCLEINNWEQALFLARIAGCTYKKEY